MLQYANEATVLTANRSSVGPVAIGRIIGQSKGYRSHCETAEQQVCKRAFHLESCLSDDKQTQLQEGRRTPSSYSQMSVFPGCILASVACVDVLNLGPSISLGVAMPSTFCTGLRWCKLRMLSQELDLAFATVTWNRGLRRCTEPVSIDLSRQGHAVHVCRAADVASNGECLDRSL